MEDDKKLKMKFKLHGLEFEIEGNQEVVKEQFKEFKSFITGDLLPNINVNSPSQNVLAPTKSVQNQIQDTTAIELNDYPVLKEVVKKDLPKSEPDWILVYAFYASSFGEETFTESDIKGYYESTGRKNDSRLKNLSNNIKSLLKKDYLKIHNDTEYLIKEEGVQNVKAILSGNSTSKISTKTKGTKTKTDSSPEKATRKKASTTQDFKLDRNLNLRPDGKESLIDFSSKYKTESTPERILLIVFYLKEILEIDLINSNHIYTGFEALNVRVPKSLYQLISDTKNKSGWLDFDSMDNIGLSIQGKNAMKFDLIIKDGGS